MTEPKVFKRAAMELKPAVTETGTTSIARIIRGDFSKHMGAGSHVCEPGDIVWLPEGTHLKYIAEERAGYFYVLYPVDWAARQGVAEP